MGCLDVEGLASEGWQMIEIKISGRGGQGAVLASHILASAFFKEGMWVQAFPSFGAERRGAPVSAFVRVNRKEITLRCNIEHPDWVILLDVQLLQNPAMLSGVKTNGCLLVNAPEMLEALNWPKSLNIFLVDASAISEILFLGISSFPVVNTAMIGAFAKASGLVSLESVLDAVRDLVPSKKERNEAAVIEAFQRVKRGNLPNQ
jgi:2-oxoacid:acceptor oxidoreductase gamma subunit (pyruvate/2-ketoisovalerate family)